MKNFTFDNRFSNELPGEENEDNYPRQVKSAFWSPVHATPVKAPYLIAHSKEAADLLNMDEQDINDPLFAQVFSGNALLPGMQSYATCYGGHQFGNWAGQLGDGRAISLGEMINGQNQRWELQLKGAGPTPYARHADGRAVLRSSIREFLCSEAVHHLGIPTTRALCIVGTGEAVLRDMFYDGHPKNEPGAVVCRVSPSFIRFGHFEIYASRGQKDFLDRLISFTINRDFPELSDFDIDQQRGEWFNLICKRTAHLAVEWMRVGFVHGVMNTDNMSILGLTIDYGPYGWIDNFDPGWTPNTTDREGRRYCFAHQPAIARWNLERLADALGTVFNDHQVLRDGLLTFDRTYSEAMESMLTRKFGFGKWQIEDMEIVDQIFLLMQRAQVDMTLFFRLLAQIESTEQTIEFFREAFYEDTSLTHFKDDFNKWLQVYLKRVDTNRQNKLERRAIMDAANPRFILRNYLVQNAIDAAENNDFSEIHRLLNASRSPYVDNINDQSLYAKRPDWAKQKAGCSMLSCSS